MFRTAIKAALLAGLVALPGAAGAAEAEGEIIDFDFSFEGPFGSFDSMQLQRGFQIYNTVCAGCHGMQFLSFQSLSDPSGPALPEAQVRAIAANYQCTDPDLPAGDTRPCLPSDRFPENTALNAPDLTLMAKGRAGFHGPAGLGISQLINGIGGPEYIATLLVSYTGEEQEVAGTILYENTIFPGGLISMAPPLLGDDVEYTAFTPLGEEIEAPAGYIPPEPTLEQEAVDVAAFMMWAAEPHMIERKQAGLRNLLMVVFLAVLLWYTNKKLWAPIKHRSEAKKDSA